MTKAQIVNILERGGWTLVQVAAGYGVTELAGIPSWWALPIATALSAAKTFAQSQVTRLAKE